ncbi:MAG: hypothetical protein ACRELY_10490 [Polyangiaceae bacterium]
MSVHPCDPPGPRRETIVKRKVVGERAAKPYLQTPIRTTVMTRTAKGVDVRRVAEVEIDIRKLEDDLPGAAALEGENDVAVTPTDLLDAVTGAALPPRPR